ncbi:hypothetical protein DFQ30_004482 [Apophysomyces sp. BC1015]|nr:hypothetical protein DFQ30_004482 [Apophysomyces sp. BC1015]
MPWRKPTNTNVSEKDLAQRAYEVWISEVMLQQVRPLNPLYVANRTKTQVATVIDYYQRWLEAFPTIYALADADIEKVNTVWAGLGYYSRARRLWEGAQKVVKDFDGMLPGNAKDLQQHIPGVGKYTAGAVASIVFGEQNAAVDGNVIRVVARIRAIGADPKKASSVEAFWDIASSLVPESRPGDFNQALMELGARVCTPVKPDCAGCPIKTYCKAVNQHEALTDLKTNDFWMTNKKRKAQVEHECAVYIIQRTIEESDEPVYLISKRPDTGLLAGLWEFPSLELGNQATTYGERSKKAAMFVKDRYKIDLDEVKQLQRHDLGNVVHLFSHIRKVYHSEWISYHSSSIDDVYDESTKWVTLEELKKSPIPTGLKKTLKVLEKFRKVADHS